MKCLIIVALVFLSGCSAIDKNALLMDLKEPQKLEEANATICEGGFLEVGFDCAELNGYPAWTHPAVLMFLGCTVNWYQEKASVMSISRSVVLASSQYALKHELKHIEGMKDNFQTGIESKDPEVIKKFTQLALKIENKYSDAGKCYELNDVLSE